MTQTTCALDACERPVCARGWCNAHYLRWSKTGDPGPAEIRPKLQIGPCSVAGCSRDRVARNMCRSHYARWRKHGDPGAAELKTWYDTKTRDDLGRKRCPTCTEWLPTDAFSGSTCSTDGLHKRCVRCERDSALRRRFGITLADYEVMLRNQGGGCAICGRIPGVGETLSIDHDHACCPDKGRSCGLCVRSALCSWCNTGLGMLQDSPELLDAAAAYLRKWSVR